MKNQIKFKITLSKTNSKYINAVKVFENNLDPDGNIKLEIRLRNGFDKNDLLVKEFSKRSKNVQDFTTSKLVDLITDIQEFSENVNPENYKKGEMPCSQCGILLKTKKKELKSDIKTMPHYLDWEGGQLTNIDYCLKSKAEIVIAICNDCLNDGIELGAIKKLK